MSVTHPPSDHPYEQMWSDSVEDLARENGIPVFVGKRPDEALIQAVRDADADLIIANNWRTWLPQEIYRAPRFGTLNVHDSLLPKYAGFSPLIWALINGGESHVGVTAHLMDDSLDGGPIVAQQAVAVGPRDTTTDLFHATVDLIEPVLLHALDLLESGRTEFTAQDPHSGDLLPQAVRARQSHRFPVAGRRHRTARACQADPYPNAFTYYNGERLRILKASVTPRRFGGTPPGRVTVPEGDGIAVVCGADAWNGGNPALVLERLRLDDGTEIDAKEFFAGRAGYLE